MKIDAVLLHQFLMASQNKSKMDENKANRISCFVSNWQKCPNNGHTYTSGYWIYLILHIFILFLSSVQTWLLISWISLNVLNGKQFDTASINVQCLLILLLLAILLLHLPSHERNIAINYRKINGNNIRRTHVKEQ